MYLHVVWNQNNTAYQKEVFVLCECVCVFACVCVRVCISGCVYVLSVSMQSAHRAF